MGAIEAQLVGALTLESESLTGYHESSVVWYRSANIRFRSMY